MTARLCAALLVAAPLTARAADDENPFRKARVGDFATYKLTTTGVAPSEGTATRTITGDRCCRRFSVGYGATTRRARPL